MPTVLAVVPHPDDESYSFAGTLALAARAGWDCRLVSLTSGERGERHDGPPAAPLTLGPLREDELRQSCQVLGVQPPEFLRLPDGELQRQADGRHRLSAILATVRPDLVLSLGPDGAYGHPDHLAAWHWLHGAWERADRAFALLYAAFPPGLFLPQYEMCLAAGIMGQPPLLAPAGVGDSPVHYRVPIAPVADRKLAAIAAHRSQLPSADPHALFPPGIVGSLLDHESFGDAAGRRNPAIAAMFEQIFR